jgi:hypothetical protein
VLDESSGISERNAMASMRRRKWAYWAVGAVILVFVIYPLSFGPIAYWRHQHGFPEWLDIFLMSVYSRPFYLFLHVAPDWCRKWYWRYGYWWMSL